MTLSKEERWKNLEESILLLMDNLHGESFLARFIDDWAVDSRILATTWKLLKDRGLVRQTGNAQRYYTLSGYGWITGLKLLDKFDTPEMRGKTGKLCAALKDKVKGRQFEQVAHVQEIAIAAGLDQDFVRDAIESNLIGELFGIQGAEWHSYDGRGAFILIPVDFGQEPLDAPP